MKKESKDFSDETTVEFFEQHKHQKGVVIWLTGLSGSGKSTIAKELIKNLCDSGRYVNSLDGDNVRNGLCSDLGFSHEDRSENIRRVGHVAKLFMENGNIVVCSCISPITKDRDYVRSIMPEGRFIETFVDASLEVCIDRDCKGLYKKALAGEIKDFTGIDSPYEEPTRCELVLDTANKTVDECVHSVLEYLDKNGITYD